MKFSRAFTMIELIFVILILGILSIVALPKFAQTKRQADIAKGRADIATIRAAIVNERQSRVVLGDASYISKLSNGSEKLFTGDGTRKLLTYGMSSSSSSGNWSGSDPNYIYYVAESQNNFTYFDSNGTFMCVSGSECSALVD